MAIVVEMSEMKEKVSWFLITWKHKMCPVTTFADDRRMIVTIAEDRIKIY